MICFGCGEKNPDSYRFCGMCGAPLQAAKTASGSEPAVAAEPPGQESTTPASENRTGNFPFSRAERLAKTARSERVPPISGPSMLGLNEPSLDSLREKAFSSADEPYFEPEARGPAWQRIFIMLVILGGLGAAAWWGYTYYVQPSVSTPRKSEPVQDVSAGNTVAAGAYQRKEPPPPAATVPSDSSTTVDVNKAEPTQGNDSAAPEQAKAEQVNPVEKTPPERLQPKSEPKSQPVAQPTTEAPAVKPATSVIASKSTPAVANAVKARPAAVPAEGDALFRRGEAYLYGRGVPESCDLAIKFLKSASDKSHARARSTFGTMYATGHCVPRDLPTSYRWFALALRVDPNNQILEKDLSAVWNQMTPPERQLATKSQ